MKNKYIFLSSFTQLNTIQCHAHINSIYLKINKKKTLIKNKAETNKHPTPAPNPQPPQKNNNNNKIKINKTNIQKIILQTHVIVLLNTGIYNYKYKLFSSPHS